MTAAPDTPLTDAQLEQWKRDGYIDPVEVLPPAEMARYAEAFRREFPRDNAQLMNRHCDLPSIGALCRDVDLWGRLASLVGPEVLLWRTNLFLGLPGLQWHEDQHARLLDGGFGVSALLAMTDGDRDNCTVLAPGSHRLTVAQKESRYGLRAELQAGGNVRYMGTLAEAHLVRMPLRAGQCLMFHPELLHASSGFLNAEGVTSPRMNLVFRVTAGDTRVTPAAYALTAPQVASPVLMRGNRLDRAYAALA